MKKFVFALLILGVTGCLNTPKIPPPSAGGLKVTPPVAPPDPALVQSCLSTQSWHNFWVILGAGLGGSAGITTAVDTATTNKNVQTGVDIGAAVAAAVAGVSTIAAGVEASTYTTNNCASVLLQAAEAGSSPGS